MKTNTNNKSLILYGKINDVLDYLKECEKEYTYMYELIKSFESPAYKKTNLN
ncbi:hypothetical protein Q428_13300 [Fervidicella metallireducens AeB]|uniref:Uncharacterized protein n=1 Tax=Fervidicella metallireducens AeB TaxID=1403537 RepID=A0A017RSK3_9CLOT|nr:hypothetical protein [Fervidicella metallireducens]EYE87444.1 hypothetical protein Q428_13300 [Fervidicella metallireducens AeB]